MKKGLLLIAIAGLLAAGAGEAAGDSIRHFPQTATEGFYRGQTIEYLDFGPVKLKPGNKLADIWSVTNGPKGQYNIIDVVPGQKRYTPLWDVNLVTWKNGETTRKLTSAAAVRKALSAGEVTVKHAGVVVNCPVI